jgi:hypothetical protein
VTLDGSHSSDPDGDSLTFEWTLQGGGVLGTTPTLTISLPLGTNIVTLKVTDPCGLFAETNVVVTVADTAPPTLSALAPITVPAGANCQTAAPDLTGSVGATDNCTPVGQLHITQSPVAGTLLSGGQHTITVTATDASGNTATTTVLFIVVDMTAPTIVSAPDPVTVSAGADCQAATPNVAAGVVATDNCTAPGDLRATQDPPAGTLLSVGQHTVTVTVKDNAGNSAATTVLVTVADTMPPSIVSTPAPITLAAGANCQAAVPDVTVGVVATDNCSPNQLQVTQSPAAGTLLAPGQYTITVTVTDAAGNNATAGVNLTITGSAPVIQSLAVNPSVLSPPNHQLVPVTVSVVTSGGCGGDLVSKIVSITADDVTLPGDIQITGNLTATLAASKNSSGNTRTYTITVQSVDPSGNTTSGTVTVVVPKSNGSSSGTGTTGGTNKAPK